MHNRILAALAVGVLLAAGMLLSAPGAQAAKVKIGFVTTLTTPAAVIGMLSGENVGKQLLRLA